MITISHIALTKSSEQKADDLFVALFGLKKKESKVLPADLSQRIFGLETEYPIIYYGDASTDFEVFITERGDYKNRKVSHLCIEVENVSDFLNRCESSSVVVSKIPKGNKELIFLNDEDGNVFEVKERRKN